MPLYPSSAVDAQAAARYAGVQADTVRQWRRRGLIAPCGGTQRRPLYRLDAIDHVLETRR
ncbi:MerR family transcriptional regulator [Streptomyces sp. ND04-05B]|uniref:helix-turn-helix domain-containing protein n=1 Tax=Streptomyces sp. ND04-05B TaxID=3028693 RepID=UPI0029A78BB4|nr:helix-turn-helix domain-containing protein [Streptomyces sp. ND04-05B]MDX3064021.1 MerR family transcriptional regulator [Streptomyces sp. ND04-05B]